MIFPVGTVLARVDQISDGGTRGFVLGEGDWPLRGLLVRLGDQVHAYLNRCPHAGHRLNFLPDRFLTPDGALILCLSHGARFDKATGVCVQGPCAGEALRRIAVVSEGDEVRLAQPLDEEQWVKREW